MTQSTTSVPRLNHHTNESASFGEIARRRRLDVRVPLRRVADVDALRETEGDGAVQT